MVHAHTSGPILGPPLSLLTSPTRKLPARCVAHSPTNEGGGGAQHPTREEIVASRPCSRPCSQLCSRPLPTRPNAGESPEHGRNRITAPSWSITRARLAKPTRLLRPRCAAREERRLIEASLSEHGVCAHKGVSCGKGGGGRSVARRTHESHPWRRGWVGWPLSGCDPRRLLAQLARWGLPRQRAAGSSLLIFSNSLKGLGSVLVKVIVCFEPRDSSSRRGGV